jgi:ABC-type transport system involved in cytochrome bd biosynthesis fused ATPase/permease subunit
MNLNLSIQFKKRELVNTKDLTLSKIQMILINDISFGFIIYIWYLIFMNNGISAPNPFFALSISLLQNMVIFIYLLQIGHTIDNLIKYTILLIILKIIPLITLYVYDKVGINYFDVYSTFYLYIIYIFVIIIIHNIFLKNNKDITKTLNNEIRTEYKENVLDTVYDKSYNDVIKQII